MLKIIVAETFEALALITITMVGAIAVLLS